MSGKALLDEIFSGTKSSGPVTLTTPTTNGKTPTVLQCPGCVLTYKTWTGLRNHMKKWHTDILQQQEIEHAKQVLERAIVPPRQYQPPIPVEIKLKEPPVAVEPPKPQVPEPTIVTHHESVKPEPEVDDDLMPEMFVKPSKQPPKTVYLQDMVQSKPQPKTVIFDPLRRTGSLF